jgi:ABC-2 type transport system ATP-binding protein
MTPPLLVLERLKKVYTRGALVKRPTFTLEADLEFPESRIVGVLGPNGAGKTTLFEMITGSNAPTEGRVLVAGADIHRVKYKERDRLAIHYHQSYQVRSFSKRVPSALLARSPTPKPILHLFDEPQFNTQILKEIGESFLLVHGGKAVPKASFSELVVDERARGYLGPDMTATAEALA